MRPWCFVAFTQPAVLEICGCGWMWMWVGVLVCILGCFYHTCGVYVCTSYEQFLCMYVLIGYYPPTREVSYLLRETRGREAPEGESSKYDTSRGRRVVTHLSPNKRSKIHGENRCIFLKIFSVLQSSPVCLRYSESAIYGKKHPKM